MNKYTVVMSEEANNPNNEEYKLTVAYLQWQGLLYEERIIPLTDILRRTKGQCNPRTAFYIFSSVSSIVHDMDGKLFLGFHELVDDVNRRGLRRI